MSAFICSDTHINALVTYAASNHISYYNPLTQGHTEVTAHNAEEIGRILMDENVRSVCCRYPDADNDQKSAGAAYRYKRFATPLTAVEAMKACHCLNYQSCETDDWESSLAWRILQAIESHAAHHVPGYDKAPWGIDTDEGLTHRGQVSLLSLARKR